LDKILDRCREPPLVRDMAQVTDRDTLFMISVSISYWKIHISFFFDQPFKYDSSFPNREPIPINKGKSYVDQWNEDHVHMPCSPKFVDVSRTHSCLFLKIFGTNIEN
jgi:hypothetical protein